MNVEKERELLWRKESSTQKNNLMMEHKSQLLISEKESFTEPVQKYQCLYDMF